MGRRRALNAVLTCPVADGEATLRPDPDLTDGWLLLVDNTQQSHVDLMDPTNLVFEYAQRIGHVIDLMPSSAPRVLHLGGGAMTLARYTAATRPRATNVVVERDPALVDLVREHLPWPSRYRIRVRIGDARTALETQPDASADLIVLDVFAGARTPGSLTSKEAFTHARRVLGDAGFLVANIADEAPLEYARRFTAGLAATFSEVAVCVEPSVLRGRRFGNLVLVARAAHAAELDLGALARRCASDTWPARVLHGERIERFTAGHAPYEDSTAPGSPVPPTGAFG